MEEEEADLRAGIALSLQLEEQLSGRRAEEGLAARQQLQQDGQQKESQVGRRPDHSANINQQAHANAGSGRCERPPVSKADRCSAESCAQAEPANVLGVECERSAKRDNRRDAQGKEKGVDAGHSTVERASPDIQAASNQSGRDGSAPGKPLNNTNARGEQGREPSRQVGAVL